MRARLNQALPILSNGPVAHHEKGKVTCVTCKLKKCVGRCRFQVVDGSGRPKAA